MCIPKYYKEFTFSKTSLFILNIGSSNSMYFICFTTITLVFFLHLLIDNAAQCNAYFYVLGSEDT